MSEDEVLRPGAFARRLDVRTRVIIKAMYEKRVPLVQLPDGTLGVPASALESFEVDPAEVGLRTY